MFIDYYVAAIGKQFQVLRLGARRGQHESRERAIQSACFMASIEAMKLGAIVDVHELDGRGVASSVATFLPSQHAGRDNPEKNARDVGIASPPGS